MPRATISSGSISLSDNTHSPKKLAPADSGRPCHLIVLADFSAHSHRGLNDANSISSRKVIEVDRDNFDDIFTKLKVQLDLPVAEESICFSEIDDLHPDFIYERVPLFDKFRHLKRRLKNNDTFSDAAKEINGWATEHQVSNEVPISATDDSNESGSLLDQLLGDSTKNQQVSSSFDIQKLIKDIVSPYVVQGPDPRQGEMLQSVDDSTSHLMRKIMHDSVFQNLEGTWRGLYLLVKRLETDSNLRIFIADVSQQEVIDDCLAVDSAEQTGLNKLLVDKNTASGASHYSMIIGDYCFDDRLEHLDVVSKLGQIASTIDASFIANGSEKLAGCVSLAQTPDKDDWSYTLTADFTSQWNKLRESSAAKHIALVAPKVLLRMPYGKRSSRTENFDFEELPSNNRHPFYLWGNGSWLISMLLAQHFSEFNWDFTPGQIQEVERLPLHVFDDDDESVVTPCAEILMTDSVAGVLSDAGLLVIRSVSGKDSVLIPKFRSLASEDSSLQGCWAK